VLIYLAVTILPSIAQNERSDARDRAVFLPIVPNGSSPSRSRIPTTLTNTPTATATGDVDRGETPQATAASPTTMPQPDTEWVYHKTADGSHPNGDEQQMVWLMNRARAHPATEGVWLATTDDADVADARTYFDVDQTKLQAEFAGYTAQPPAAFDVRLYQAAKRHSDDLIARDAQDHDQQFQRISDAGFVMQGGRGNIFAYADSALGAHGAWNIDWDASEDGMQDGRPHRNAVMSLDGEYTNVGIAAVPETDATTAVGPLVVTGNYVHAGSAADHFNRFIVGTVWRDLDGDDFYDPGEGIGSVTVTPDHGAYFAVTAQSGGYAIPISEPGSYQVRFNGGNISIRTVTITETSVLLDWQQEP